MPRPKIRTLVTLVLLLALTEVLAVFFFNVVRREALVAGTLSIAGVFTAIVVVGLLLRHWGGLAWPFSYLPHNAAVKRRPRRETGFATISGHIESYLSNWSRPDELHPLLTALVRDRLQAHHGIDLADRQAARPVLGEELATYVYAPPATSMSNRNRQHLTRLITRIEEL